MSESDPALPELKYRRTDFVFVGKKMSTIVGARLTEVNGRIAVTEFNDFPYYACIGNDEAKKAIGNLLDATSANFPVLTGTHRTALARRAIAEGVAHCGVHPHDATIRSCGGSTFVRDLAPATPKTRSQKPDPARARQRKLTRKARRKQRPR